MPCFLLTQEVELRSFGARGGASPADERGGQTADPREGPTNAPILARGTALRVSEDCCPRSVITSKERVSGRKVTPAKKS